MDAIDGLMTRMVTCLKPCLLATTIAACTVLTAQAATEPLGGQPPAGATPSVKDFDYQVKYQRAFEAILWNMPAIAIYSFRRAAEKDLGYKDNDIIAYSATATPQLEAITANSTTPYIAAYTDLRKGPVVLEIPAASADGSLYGQVVDAWQLTIADVGPAGLDRGKGGKYLFTAPDYKGEVPKGYIHVASPNYRIALAFRSVPPAGKTAKDAYEYAKRLRMYFLAEAKSPPQQKFIDPAHERYPTLPFYDERHFEDMHAIMSVEPVREHDKVMMGMLSSLGIVKGKPFAPDETAKKAMHQAAIDAWFFLQQWFDTEMSKRVYWPDRHYVSLLQPDANHKFTFIYDDRIDLLERAAEYFWCTYMPKVLSASPATSYQMAMADKDGKPLEAGQLYKLDVPKDMPVKQFWALTVYDRATFSFIYSDSNRTTLSSFDVDKMKKNADGGVTIYVGPTAPQGEEANWIPTSGKRPLPAMRFYGPTEAFNNKTFKLPDFERVIP
ncbi:DUF1254 domain-containing protein [Pseudomonas sp. SbB1]|uniref:DUF1254 domain-containing protein n=2 Tax=Pseudomonas TaxID=286 RepID=B0KFK6_PSEPG|nr:MULTISPECIES: DUF1214 domain-containing protein [unclassified Pseudomonas]ABY98929.1 protein of unknown function DUF1214 [Pseudomonas putida GB-1]NOG88294.1 DUF1254 domain-containing protein [Pseudomonas sp. SbB1]RNF70063.1 DUF1254 domain-containing protein [Pseudomonas putida]MBP0708863.1 DUF1254 domain-containing protein [Pseudomonas sp. T34]HDS1712105.1 DUF1254 domain-containing protein [Pseudomonas putida]